MYSEKDVFLIFLPRHWNSTTDICCSPLLFTNIVLIDSPTYLCQTFVWPLSHYRVIITLPAVTSATQVQPERLISCNNFPQVISRSIWMWVAEVIAGNVVIMRWSCKGQAKVCQWIYKDNICKDQWWLVSRAPNIYGEEFQHVGRSIFIKSKNISFSLYNNNFNQDF